MTNVTLIKYKSPIDLNTNGFQNYKKSGKIRYGKKKTVTQNLRTLIIIPFKIKMIYIVSVDKVLIAFKKYRDLNVMIFAEIFVSQ